MSASFQEDKGSFLWVLAPIALISSLILAQFFFSSAIEAFFKDDTLVGPRHVRLNAKRWGLITGLRVYLSSSFFAMGFKVVAPLLAVFLTWPALGFQALVAVYRLYQLTRAIQLIQNFTFWMKDSENPGNVQARRCNCWDGSHFPGPSCGLPLVVDDISPTAFSFQTGCREILMIARVVYYCYLWFFVDFDI
ncbi:hypothetical protein GOBAR_AA26477 [Gossypium barbadense]|uniref:Uncharacterized protein n=1 Tax=Gossypium barbadense TaxID=3634 RepID=A0A2P5WSW7_GOSBA|nr:hypothetical protein GOBAR_AA26477 [Gossypium barbadense]